MDRHGSRTVIDRDHTQRTGFRSRGAVVTTTVLLALAAGTSSADPAAAAPPAGAAGADTAVVRAQDLGNLPGALTSTATATNLRGQVVGTSGFNAYADDVRPFLWERGVMRDLGTFEGRSAAAADINERGQVLITTSPRDFYATALVGVWQRGRLTNIGGLGGDTYAVEINDRGQVLANSKTPASVEHAVLWRAGRLVDLGLLPGGGNAWATDLNERGDVVGTAQDAHGETHLVMWPRGRPGPVPLAPASGTAPTVNERGAVAFTTARTVDQVPHAAVWQRGRVVAETAVSADATDINDRGTVVGSTQEIPDTTPFQAMLWEQRIVTTLPKPAGFEYSVAHWINNRGQALGFAGMNDYSRSQVLVWQRGHAVTLAPLHPGDSVMYGGAIDERGQVPGSSWAAAPDGQEHGSAVLWTVRPTI